MNQSSVSKSVKRIAFAGGGVSGGHVTSIVAIFQGLQTRIDAREIECIWIGSKQGREKYRAESLGIPFVSVPVGKLRRYWSMSNVLDFFRIPFGVLKSLFVLNKARPFVLFVSGGYVSLPPAIAAWMLRIPVMVHENDVMPGLANRMIARFATTIFTGSEEAKLFFEKKYGAGSGEKQPEHVSGTTTTSRKKIIVTGIPLREDIKNGNIERAYTHFLFKSNIPTLLVIGGAQGARTLNQVVIEAREELEKMCQIIHICGEAHYRELRAQHDDSQRYRLFPYLHHELKDAFAIAQLALTRGSAHVLNELAYYGVPSIIVPMHAYSSGHQRENAKRFETVRAAIVVDEDQLNASQFIELVKRLCSDPKELAMMQQQATSLFIPDATHRILDELLSTQSSHTH